MSRYDSTTFRMLNHHIDAPKVEIERLLDQSKEVAIKANQVLMQADEAPKHFYLVESGLLRAVYVTPDGKEFSKEFYWENDIIFGIRCMLTNQPLPYSVIAVENCALFQLPIATYRELVDRHHEWKNYHIKQVETHLLYKEIKEELLLINSNQQKVEEVYRLFPDFVNRVPAILLATYLGLSPVSLSRIKKRLNLA
ncbi:Crp/Fnr family transcriptional regulator [Aliikangiella coralliicola]|uniref:Crp/Fnr family transcriptional regulator n=1 Tax=Aliikangiella coralliicola TaxID=2592383 RepID=A0A545U6H2_9GAMM|nr:Crp/Fnr family transcriptional regulator [Aliikangiella coralliicola]TQV85075.1 Crp/Fnr family transcriptional regulator [Aliikangiella coralliicola]